MFIYDAKYLWSTVKFKEVISAPQLVDINSKVYNTNLSEKSKATLQVGTTITYLTCMWEIIATGSSYSDILQANSK
jgi:hypothetical protein